MCFKRRRFALDVRENSFMCALPLRDSTLTALLTTPTFDLKLFASEVKVDPEGAQSPNGLAPIFDTSSEAVGEIYPSTGCRKRREWQFWFWK